MTRTATQDRPKAGDEEETLLPLEAGDHLDRATFHRRYRAMPSKFQAELIEGVVIVPSPVGLPHGRMHALIMTWIGTYHIATPGTIPVDNATVLLGDLDEVQPDGGLLIQPDRGGRTRHESGYVEGGPELAVEVASSSASYDLHSKLRLYERAGVREYLVILLHEPTVRWFRRSDEGFVALEPGSDGQFQSVVFPGLRLDPVAVENLDGPALMAALQAGLGSPEHAAFVASLQKN